MECTESFTNLLSEFQCVFTQPSFPIFVCLMTGWVLSHRRRFVTELIWSSGCTHKGHHSRYHRFFSKASWCLDALCCVLAKLLVRFPICPFRIRCGDSFKSYPMLNEKSLI